MTAATASTPAAAGYTTSDVVGLAGATYRQVDYWARLGLLHPPHRYSLRAAGGCGNPRVWRPVDVRAAMVVAQLARLGAVGPATRAAAAYVYRWAEDLPERRAGWLVVTVDAEVSVVDDLDAGLELLVAGGAWVIPVPDAVAPIG